MSSLFDKYASSTSSSSSEEVVEVKVSSLSSPIKGEYGEFRVFKVNGKKFTIDNRKVVNAQCFSPNCEATLTLIESEKYPDKVFVSGLNIHLPKGSGYFIMT
jgi:hypothetical protein